MATRGDALNFRSISGLIYPAKLVGVLASVGRCSIEVDVGCNDWFPLTMVRWSERDNGENFTAWPKEASGGEGTVAQGERLSEAT